MIEHIYVDGPGSEEFGVTGAIGDLYAELIKHFGSSEALNAAYYDALSELEAEEENLSYPGLARTDRPPTPFEAAFKELSQKIHARERYDADTQFEFALPF